MLGLGQINPLLFAAGDPLDELGKINRALRTRASVGGYLSRTPSVAGNQKTWAWFGWCKIGKLASVMSLFNAGSTAASELNFYFDSTGHLYLDGNPSGSGPFTAVAAPQFSDPCAHVPVMLVFDSTQATAADRVKIYVEDILLAAAAGNSYPTQINYVVNSTVRHSIGVTERGSTNYFDGVFSFVGFVDGSGLTPALIGRRHPKTGQFRPYDKARIRANIAALGGARNGWGANGFFLQFELADFSGTTVYDRSQSDTDTTGNNWTATNISLTAGPTYDSMLDTPTNNFCTLNPLGNLPNQSTATCLNGNLQFKQNYSASLNSQTVSTMYVSSGKWVWEASVTQATSPNTLELMGISNAAAGADPRLSSVCIRRSNGNKYVNGDNSGTFGTAGALSDIYSFELDMDSGTLAVWRNDASLGNLATGLSGYYTPYGWMENGSSTAGVIEFNFGQRPFSRTPSTGFKSLCTKNLPFPRIPNPKSAFVAVTDSGANIASTLASARSGWPDYIDIIKRRDAAEGWRWIFSDDPTAYMDSSSTGAKAAIPAFGGTAYVGYSLKVSPANGVATGRLTHVAGTADVVSDGLANSRKVVMLRSEAGGPWFFYHPELTTGKLLYLNTTDAETTDATISSVTASGFTVAAALASGIYRWIVISEISGLIKLSSRLGSSSTNGPFSNDEIASNFIIEKCKDVAGEHTEFFDTARNPSNPVSSELRMNLPNGENTGTAILDSTSSGVKWRVSSAPNVSGRNYVGIHIGQPFRYANAR